MKTSSYAVLLAHLLVLALRPAAAEDPEQPPEPSDPAMDLIEPEDPGTGPVPGPQSPPDIPGGPGASAGAAAGSGVPELAAAGKPGYSGQSVFWPGMPPDGDAATASDVIPGLSLFNQPFQSMMPAGNNAPQAALAAAPIPVPALDDVVGAVTAAPIPVPALDDVVGAVTAAPIHVPALDAVVGAVTAAPIPVPAFDAVVGGVAAAAKTTAGIGSAASVAVSGPPVKKQLCTTNFPTAINEFAFKIYKELGTVKETKNIVFSPLSISVVLAMVFKGAFGATATQMSQVLEFDKYNEIGLERLFFAYILRLFTKENADYKLLLGHFMYLGKNYTINEDYANEMSYFYDSVVQNVDFRKNGQAAVDGINKAVANRTEDKIRKLIGKPFSPPPAMVLVSVSYFKGLLKNPFSKSDTKARPFITIDGKSINANFMARRNDKYFYLDDPITQYKFLQLPYKGGKNEKGEAISLLIALPKGIGAPPDLQMTPELLCRLQGAMKNDTLMAEVAIPKFKVEYKPPLKEALKTLGMVDIFQPSKANLTGVSQQQNLYLDTILHKSVVVFDEGRPDGKKAPAAPASSIVAPPILALPSFIADRPFLFYLVDELNGLIWFYGKVIEP